MDTPPKGWIKLNFNGCSKRNLGMAIVGGLFFDDKGRVMEGYAKGLGIATSNETEAINFWWGLKRAKQCGYRKLIIEADSKLIIEALKGKMNASWKIKIYIEDSKILINSLD